MYYEFIQSNKRRAGIIAVIIITLIAAWGVSITIEQNGKIPVTVSVVPNSAIVTIDGRIIGNGTHWVKAGSYTVKTEKNGFKNSTRKVIINDQKNHNVIAVSLVPQSEEAKKWASDNSRDYAVNEQYGAIEANSNGRYFTAKNPITTKLPFTDPYFKIAYKTNDDQSIVLTVDTPSPRYRFYAIEKIREFGYDPTDFVIEFKDFHNPLEQK